MPWYKIFCNSGPGHQSHHEFYEWHEKKLSREERKERWEEAFEERDWPIGDMKLVEFLPEDVKKQKIESLNKTLEEYIPEQIKRTNKLLVTLLKTPVKGCDHLFTEQIKSFPTIVTKCKNCHKIKIYGAPKWREMPKNLDYVLNRLEAERNRKRKI